MNNKLKSVYVCLFLFLLMACSDQEEETIEIEFFEVVIGDTFYLNLSGGIPTLKSDKDIYQFRDSVDLTLIVTPVILTDVASPPIIYEFETKEFVEWNIYNEEILIFNYPKVFHPVDSSNIIFNGIYFTESLLWLQKNNDNEFVGIGEYKIVATILDIDHPSSANIVIKIE